MSNENTQLQVQAKINGQLKGSNLDEQWRLADAFCRSGMLPKAYKTTAQVLVGMQYAYELGLKPLSAMKNIAVINGQPSLWGELPLAIVRNSGKLEYIKEYTIDSNYKEISVDNKNLSAKIYAAVCILKRVGDKEEKKFFFTREMANKNGGVPAIWNNYEAIMFKRKARSIGLKDLFGDILEGMNIAEYDFNAPVHAGEVVNLNHDGERITDSADSLNSLNVDDSVAEFDPDKKIEAIETLRGSGITEEVTELEFVIDKEPDLELESIMTDEEKAFKEMREGIE